MGITATLLLRTCWCHEMCVQVHIYMCVLVCALSDLHATVSNHEQLCMHEHTHIICMSSGCMIMMIETLCAHTHVRVCSCVDGCLHTSEGVQACRPACTQVCMFERRQAHKAWCGNSYNHSLGPEIKVVISACFTMINHDDQNPSCMHACQGWDCPQADLLGSN